MNGSGSVGHRAVGVPGVRVIARRALPPRWQHRRPEEDDRGSITAYLLITTVAIFALAGLVLDGGAALAAHGRAADVAQQAARAGADALDETSLRSATPAGLTANPAAALPSGRQRTPSDHPHTRHTHRAVTIRPVHREGARMPGRLRQGGMALLMSGASCKPRG